MTVYVLVPQTDSEANLRPHTGFLWPFAGEDDRLEAAFVRFVTAAGWPRDALGVLTPTVVGHPFQPRGRAAYPLALLGRPFLLAEQGDEQSRLRLCGPDDEGGSLLYLCPAQLRRWPL